MLSKNNHGLHWGVAKIKIEYWFDWPNKYTFYQKGVLKFISKFIPKGSKVLVPFAGKFRFGQIDGSEFIYNDINPEISAEHHIDAYKLVWLYKKGFFDCIIADPPYTIRKAIEIYKNEKHMKICRFRDSVRYLLRLGGIYIELGYNSNGIYGFEKLALGICNVGIKRHDILIIVQKKPNIPTLMNYLEV